MSDLKDYVDIKPNNLKSSNIIDISKQVINNAKHFFNQEAQVTNENREQAIIQMRGDKESFEKIKKNVSELESMQENQMKD